MVRHVVALALAVLSMAAAAGMVVVDVLVLRNRVTEHSLTETAQECLLAFATCAALHRAWRDIRHRGVALLLAGLCGAMLFREMDGFFDRVLGHGAWKAFVWPWLALTIGLAFRYRHGLMRTCGDFMGTRAYAFIVTGLLVILVYSRILGHKALWNIPQEEALSRATKNTVEEGVELLGYVFLAYGAGVFGTVPTVGPGPVPSDRT